MVTEISCKSADGTRLVQGLRRPCDAAHLKWAEKVKVLVSKTIPS